MTDVQIQMVPEQAAFDGMRTPFVTFLPGDGWGLFFYGRDGEVDSHWLVPDLFDVEEAVLLARQWLESVGAPSPSVRSPDVERARWQHLRGAMPADFRRGLVRP